ILLTVLSPRSTLFPYTTLFRSCRYYILYYLVGNLQIWFVADKLLTPELHPSLHYHGSRTVRHFKYLQYTGNCSYSIKILQFRIRSEEHTSELQSRENLVCRLLL